MEKELDLPKNVDQLRDDFSKVLDSFSRQEAALMLLLRPEHLFTEKTEVRLITLKLKQSAIDHFTAACDRVSSPDERERELNYNFAIVNNAIKTISEQINAFKAIPENTPDFKEKQREIAGKIVENLSDIKYQSADLNNRSLDLRTNHRQVKKREMGAVAALKESITDFKFSADLYTEALDKLVSQLNDKGFTKTAEQLEAATTKLYTALTENNNASIRLSNNEDSAKKIRNFTETLNEITVKLNKHNEDVGRLPKGSTYAGLDDDGKRIIDSISITTADLSVKIDDLRKVQPEKKSFGIRR